MTEPTNIKEDTAAQDRPPPPSTECGLDALPAELRRHPNWVTWRPVWSTKKRGWDKPPLQLDGRGASTTNSKTWSSFDGVAIAHRADPSLGVGFVLSSELEIVFVDLDHCFINDHVAPWAWDIMMSLSSYTEVSPSRDGLHILCRATKSTRECRYDLPHGGRVEIYAAGRYATMTGRLYDGMPGKIEARQAEIARLCAQLWPPPEAAAESPPKADGAQTHEKDGQKGGNGHTVLSDVEILRLASRASNGAKFQRLLDGDISAYQSPSEADLALMGLLVFYTQNAEQLARLWRTSGLCRNKVDRPDYVRRTIGAALAGCKERYVDRTGTGSGDSIDEHSEELTRRRFVLVDDEELERQPPPNFVVDGVLVEKSTAVVVGAPGSFKSFVALDLAAHIGTGRKWHDRQTRGGSVVYVLAEGRGAFGCRVRAWKNYHHHAGAAGILFCADAVQLHERGDLSAFLGVLDDLPEPPLVVVVDTLARCAVGIEENSAKEMGVVVAGLDRIRTATGAAVVALHHTPRNEERERGSAALRAATDTLLVVVADGEEVTVRIDRQKDVDPIEPLRFRRRVVDCGDGRSSCVLVPTEGHDRPPRTLRELPRSQQLIVEAMRHEPVPPPTHLQRGVGLAERTFWQAVQQLRKSGFVDPKRFRLTPGGEGLFLC